MPAFLEKALLIVLNTLGVVAGLITIGVLALMVGAVGAFLGYVFAVQNHLPVFLQYGAMAVFGLLAPVWLATWLWQNLVRPDDEPPPAA